MSAENREDSAVMQALTAEFTPLIRALAGAGRYAISIGGSRGKGVWDSRSDVDFRLFCEHGLPGGREGAELWRPINEAIEAWGRKGVIVDGVWVRKIGDIDAALERWLNGEARPDDLVWTIWGYYLLPDIRNQAIVEDPFDVIGGWQRRLQVYPPRLKQAILNRHLASVRYWRHDYHYLNKLKRGDVVFAAGLASRLVHDLIQILFALNDTFYVGDGRNLETVEGFALAPAGFTRRVREILYPPPAGDILEAQHTALAGLMDEVMQLADQAREK